MRTRNFATAAVLVVLLAPAAASAQHAAAGKIPASSHEALDASAARLAMKAAFEPQTQPTREELLRVIVIMSLRQQRSGT
ncbi:MAG: hypothetical protein JO261_02420 [Alphaproteobacteria bacterium]|nr:hypothetical protein [Alphaproteobacteria bacterium]MBV9692534.1 hypothetical protein [Alphaproteobacteria bacterium]